MKKYLKNSFHIILFVTAIFFVSLIIRLYGLNINSPSLYADEVSGGYQAFNLLHNPINGAGDLINRVLLGVTRSTWYLGLTPLGTRFPSAFFGSLVPVIFFFLSKYLSKTFGPKKSFLISIISSTLTAFLPWNFMTSRIGYAQIPLIVIMVCLNTHLLIKAKKPIEYLLSLIPILFGVIFYPSMVVLFPFVILMTLYFLFRTLNPNQKKIWSIVFLFSIIVLGGVGVSKYHIFDPKYRGLDLAIWNDANVAADSNHYRGLSRLSTPTPFSFNIDTESIANKLFFNKPISVIQVFTKNYLSFFSPDFLFLKGDIVLRHSIGMVGEFFPFLLPFIIYGAFIFFFNSDKKQKTIFLIWILISPIPAAITKDGATYLLRVITLMPFLTYFSALGIVNSLEFFKNKYIKFTYGIIIGLISVFSIYYFLFGYFHVYPALSAQSWEYGFKDLSDFNATNKGKILVIWDDKYPVWYFCFWQKLPSNICDQKKINSSENLNGSRIDLPIDNLSFSLPQNEKDFELINLKYKPIYIAMPGKYTDNFPVFIKKNMPIQVIKYPDQSTAFTIYKINN